MKIKTIYIEAKRSKNFQTFTVGKTIELEPLDDEQTITREQQILTNDEAKRMIDEHGNKK